MLLDLVIYLGEIPPNAISAIPLNIIWVAKVTIIGGNSVNFVKIKPFINPQIVPVNKHIITANPIGTPAL